MSKRFIKNVYFWQKKTLESGKEGKSVNNCIYCEDISRRETISIYLCDLKVSTVYLLYDQTYPGRCAVAYREHKTELFQLTSEERAAFMDDVALAAQAVSELFEADKIQYAIFGDKMPHLHVHLAVKRADDPDFGSAYNLSKQEKRIFTKEQAEERAACIRQKIADIQARA